MRGIIVDLFAGGGGASTGIEAARLIGNSVAPEVAEAVIRANFEAAEEMAA